MDDPNFTVDVDSPDPSDSDDHLDTTAEPVEPAQSNDNQPEQPQPQTAPSPTHPIIPAPPNNQIFLEFQHAYDYLQQFARAHGFAVMKKRSFKSPKFNDQTYKVCLACDKSGRHTSKATVRKTKSRRINCPFEAVVTQYVGSSQWNMRVRIPFHNHGPSTSTAKHPSHIRDELQRKLPRVQRLIQQDIPDRFIVSILRAEDPSSCAREKDIRNLRSSMHNDSSRRKQIEEKLPKIRALLAVHVPIPHIAATLRTDDPACLLKAKDIEDAVVQPPPDLGASAAPQDPYLPPLRIIPYTQPPQPAQPAMPPQH